MIHYLVIPHQKWSRPFVQVSSFISHITEGLTFGDGEIIAALSQYNATRYQYNFNDTMHLFLV